MSNELVEQQTKSAQAVQTTSRMEVGAIRERLNAVESLMRGVMQKDIHFGVIKGCGNKPTLLKPGAEMLGMMFRLSPKLEVKITNMPNGHREYSVTCTLVHIPTGEIWAEGVGSCSTMESKYRWRSGEAIDTGRTVPKAYWDAKNAGDYKKMASLLGGPNFVAKRSGSSYTIHEKSGERVENPDIADCYNTCLKMAKKRAQIDSTLSALGCSHMFTQDIEDLPMGMYDDGPAHIDYEEVPPNHQSNNQPPADATVDQAKAAMEKAAADARKEKRAATEEDRPAFVDFIQTAGAALGTFEPIIDIMVSHGYDTPEAVAPMDFRSIMKAVKALLPK